MGVISEAASCKPPVSSQGPDSKQDINTGLSRERSNLPTSFSIMTSLPTDPPTQTRPESFGVQSLDETLQSIQRDGTPTDSAQLEKGNGEASASQRQSSPDAQSLEHLSANVRQSPNRTFLAAALSKKLPVSSERSYPPSPGADSVPLSTPRSTSMKSFRLSDDDVSADEDASQAVASSVEDEDDRSVARDLSEAPLAEEAPQLVMPSVQMPRRRSFTERGSRVGKLRIMVAGRKNTGKTSLIKSILQSCEDIVHVDPIDTHLANIHLPENTNIGSNFLISQRQNNTAITEMFASSRAYPNWFNEVDSSRILKRSKTSDDTILERNILFIDTPGYDSVTSFQQHNQIISKHIEERFHRNASLAFLSDSELMDIFSGSGGHQVDVVLFLFHAKEAVDVLELDFVRQLSQVSNLVPIIAHADRFSPTDLVDARANLSQQLLDAGIDTCNIMQLVADRNPPRTNQTLLAVSSAPARDDENIDASLLMSSEYVQPLEPSDLQSLTEGLFDADTAAYLRHCALRKFFSWRQNQSFHVPSTSPDSLRNARRAGTFPTIARPIFQKPAGSSASTTSTSGVSSMPSTVLIDRRRSQPDTQDTDLSLDRPYASYSANEYRPPNTYTAARLLDHTQREERMAQVRLARWAADLQRAIRNERARFATLKQDERTAWLEERLEECVDPDGENGALIRKSSHATEKLHRHQATSSGDPLGLLEWRAQLSERGLKVAKVLGGVGFVGAAVLYVVRTWTWGMDLIPYNSSLRDHSSLHDWWWARDW